MDTRNPRLDGRLRAALPAGSAGHCARGVLPQRATVVPATPLTGPVSHAPNHTMRTSVLAA
jgi:hypothetical protein